MKEVMKEPQDSSKATTLVVMISVHFKFLSDNYDLHFSYSHVAGIVRLPSVVSTKTEKEARVDNG